MTTPVEPLVVTTAPHPDPAVREIAVVTKPHEDHAPAAHRIFGRIPIDHPAFPAGHVDVTPHVLYFPEAHPLALEAAYAVAHAIEFEHHARGTHPVQIACKALDDPAQYKQGDPAVEAMKAAHREQHGAHNARMAAGKPTPSASSLLDTEG